ncbi:uncharacterized protein LOC125444516 isoform X2 [Sphaerodactylus townsendi]|nr:uncharacterized protein LOC125444516 isoform X2 [Sphaerodactylus townsendi]
MAPSLAARDETVTPLGFSTPIMGSLGSVAPVIIIVLLLLLCSPFRRKKRQLSTRTLKKNATSSELLSITKLEDRQNLKEKPPEEGTLHKGSSLPNNPDESQTNGCVSHPLPANALKYPGTTSPNHQKTEKSGRTVSFGPQMSCPDATIPGSLQLRKLPMTPREEDISRAELLNPGLAGRVYESIKVEERTLCSGDKSKGQEGSGLPSNSSNCSTVESSGKQNRPAEIMGMPPGSADASVPGMVTLERNESHMQLQELTCERDAPTESTSDVEKKLRAMYARVCKKPKAEQQFQPANHDRPTEESEEEPPPIPEKHFDDIYESIDEEVQGSVVTPPDA